MRRDLLSLNRSNQNLSKLPERPVAAGAIADIISNRKYLRKRVVWGGSYGNHPHDFLVVYIVADVGNLFWGKLALDQYLAQCFGLILAPQIE